MKAQHLELVPRAGQVLFCAVCVATSAAIGHATVPTVPLGVLIAICASACGLVYSSFRIIVHFCSRKIEKALPGVIDLVLSAVLAASLLSAGINVAAVGICYARNGTAVIMPRDAVASMTAQQQNATLPPVHPLPIHFGGVNSASGDSHNAAQSNPPTSLNHLVTTAVQETEPTSRLSETAANTSALGRRMLHLSLHVFLQPLHISSEGNRAVGWRNIGHSSSGDGGYFPASGRRLLSSVQSVPLRSRSAMICSCWDATVTLCFLNFLLYAISCAVACLDIRLGKGILVINKKAIVHKFFDQHSDARATNANGEAGGNRAAGSSHSSDSEFGDADVDIIIVPVQELVTQPAHAARRSSSDTQR